MGYDVAPFPSAVVRQITILPHHSELLRRAENWIDHAILCGSPNESLFVDPESCAVGTTRKSAQVFEVSSKPCKRVQHVAVRGLWAQYPSSPKC